MSEQSPSRASGFLVVIVTPGVAHRELERDLPNTAYFQTREPARPDKAQDTVTLWLLEAS